MAGLPGGLGVIGQGLGTLLTSFGLYQQGQAQEAAGNYNATVASQNADIAIQQSKDQAQQVDREAILALGAMRASAGASGGGQTSFLDVIGDTAAQYELQKQQTLYGGKLAARGYRNTAAIEKFQGKQAAYSGKLAAAGALLSGSADTYGSFQRLG